MASFVRPLLIAAALLSTAASPAWACRAPPYVEALIHSEVPRSLPDDLVVLQVEFAPDLTTGEFRRAGAQARILRVLRGRVLGASIWVSPEDGGSSCSYPFANGRVGLIVGRLGTQGGRRALEPRWVSRRSGFRLRGH